MDIPYKIVRSARKTVAIQITPAGEVLLRCPRRFSAAEARRIVESRRTWIEKQLSRQQSRPVLPPFSPAELEAMKQKLRPVLEEKVKQYAPIVGVSCGKITIRSQKTLWGSCTSEGNLSFNCLLAEVPAEILDYVVIHELCHRKYMNHSAAFWTEVERAMPDYRIHKKWLKEQGAALIARVS